MSNIRVSVVIPVYNVTTFLSQAIESSLSDDYPGVEIVVVNDGSHEEATQEITEICERYPQVLLVHQENMRQAQARRTGVINAQGEYIIFLDGDDILLPGAIEYLVKHMDKNPEAVAVYGKKIRMTEQGDFIRETLTPYPNHEVSGDVLPALLWGEILFSHGNIAVRRKFLVDLDYPTGIRQGEDWITWCRLALRGDIIYAGDRVLLALRDHGDNVSRDVIDNPAELMEMFEHVYEDERIIKHIGAHRLETYRYLHLRQIHQYLYYCYYDSKRYWRALKQKWILRTLPPKRSERIRVLHVCKWFYAGGAERILTSVLAHSDSDKFEHIVLSLSDQGERIADVQHTLGIPFKSFELVHGKFDYKTHRECFNYIRRIKPDLVKTWLAPANITGGIMAKLLRKKLIWGIHNSHNENITGPLPLDVRIQTKLARWLPDAVLCCGVPSYETCVQFNYDQDRLHMITNGTDTDAFKHSVAGRKKVRKELGIDDDTILIGMAAECRPHKRQPHFLMAAKQLLLSKANVRFLLCGIDNIPENEELMSRVEFLELKDHVHLLGIRNDMADIYSALDIHTLNPVYEPFGLATTEAMSCETLCIGTDVGMMRELLEDVGIVYPMEEDPTSLVNAWKKTMALSPKEKKRRTTKARKRVMEKYSIIETAKKYDALFDQVMSR